MKVILVTICAFVAAFGAPVQRNAEELTAIRAQPARGFDFVQDEFGQYAWRYVTAEGTVVSQRGRLVPNRKGDGYVMIMEGETSYIGDDDKVYTTKFSADLDGTYVEGNYFSGASEVNAQNTPETLEVPGSE